MGTYRYVGNALDVYSETIKLLKARRFLHAEEILPLYVCSIGAHIFNRMNKKKYVLTDSGLIPDTRLHVFMVTIPGFGKSHLLNEFMSKHNGLLYETKVGIGRISSMTSAGLVGSIKSTPDGAVVQHKGLLQTKNKHIIGCDEFANLTMSGKAVHSMNLTNDLLSALDSGDMRKHQGAGGLEYETYTTMWGATQPGRFELKSGLQRRFVYVVVLPTYKDAMDLRKNRRLGKNVAFDQVEVIKYRMELNKRVDEVETNLKKVIFPDEYYSFVEKHFVAHYEEMLFERILLGYNIMRASKVEDTLELKLDDTVKRIIEQQVADRFAIQQGVKKTKIWPIIREFEKLRIDDVHKLLMSFALEPDEITRGLYQLETHEFIKMDNGMCYNLKWGEKDVL